MTGISTNSSESLFVDTSAIYALINRSDIDHKRARDCLSSFSSGNIPLITSNFVLSETYTLILYKIWRDTALRVINGVRDAYEIERISMEDEEVAWQIINDFDDKKNSPMSMRQHLQSCRVSGSRRHSPLMIISANIPEYRRFQNSCMPVSPSSYILT